MRSTIWSIRGALSVVMGALVLLIGVVSPAAAATGHTLIQGSGSGWAANAVNQWIADVQPNGLQVVYTASGSAQGRKDFAYKTTDFAVSDIGYQGVDPVTGDQDTSNRPYAYLPVVAGGTALPYHLSVAGKLIRNLRLSGLTVAKIFTNQIRNWDDPQITKDNNGHSLPSLPIIPVVHSEGSGATAQFTRYLAHLFPAQWRPFAGYSGFTEYFPRRDPQIAQNGADGVMNFIASASANGAIGYDEYSYALNQNYPVAKLENQAGYFTLPNEYNVAVALTQAKINYNTNPSVCPSLGFAPPCYLLQNLDKVYTYGDIRTYPLSSYSYAIIPIASNDQTMTTSKRQTLADYLFYSICAGQKEMGPIGYSPLPINLVEAGFKQIGQLKKADSNVDLTSRNITTCHNPTFVPGQPTRNYLAEIAPKPQPCDKAGSGPCTNAGVVTVIGGPGDTTGGNSGTPSGSPGPKSGGGSGNPTPAGGGGATPSANSGELALPVSAVLAASPPDPSPIVLGGLAVLLLLGVLFLPPLLARHFRKAPI